MLKKLSICLSVMILMTALLTIQAAAAASEPPDAGAIAIANKLTGTPDTVTVGGVTATDIIRVYSGVSGGAPIGVTLASDTSATVYVNQLGKGTGIAYVSVTSTGLTESSRTPVPFDPEPKTVVVSDQISIQNSVGGRPDIVTVQALAEGDIIRVYPNSVSTVTLGTAVSPSDDATVIVYVNQLGIAAGTVFVTIQSDDMLESDRTPVGYESETSTGLDVGTVRVENKHYAFSGGAQEPGTEDIVMVPGVAVGDIITIYKASIGPDTWLPPLTVAAGSFDIDGNVPLIISQLGEKAGKIYVTITRVGKAESKRVIVAYPAEPITDPLVLDDVEVLNNYLIADTVNITGLTEGDTVNIYTTPVSLTPIGSETVAPGGTSLSISIIANTLSVTGGKIYITVTSPIENESTRLMVKYDSEETNSALSAGRVNVTNNYGISDPVVVTGLAPGDIIKVYATPTGATLIGTGTAAVDTATIMLDAGQLSKKRGNIYVTITTATANESPRATVPYNAEPVSPSPVANTITVTNNYNASDTVIVPGLQSGDIIKVYLASTGDNQIGSGTEAGGSASASIEVGKLSATGGNIYVTVTSQTANESPRVLVKYFNEETTGQPLVENIEVTNNYLISDDIVISAVPNDATVTIYVAAKGTAIYGSGTETGGQFSLTLLNGKLSAAGGKIYVSVKMTTANESPRTAFTYSSERSTAPVAGSVVTTNNYFTVDAMGTQVPASKDSVMVPDLQVGDIVRIYKASGGTAMLCDPETVTAAGPLTIPVSQLGTKPGKIFVTITQLNRSESVRMGVSFISEPTTNPLLATSIVIENNYAAEDNVIISDLTIGQIVTIYTSAIGTTILDTVTVTDTSKTFTLDVGTLTAGGGKLYISVKDDDKLESLRTAQVYTSETTAPPKTSNILVVNYLGTAFDTVTMTGLIPGDVVRIYSLATGGTLLSTATVTEKGTTFTLDTNLADIAGTIYVTVTNDGKAESKRIMVKYDAA